MATLQPPAARTPVIRTWLKKVFDSSLRAAIIGAILGSFLTFIIPVIYHSIVGPPSDDIVKNLMGQDVVAAKTHNVETVPSMYAYNAVVVDARCPSPSPSNIWSGLPQITDRYVGLPQFITLAHVNVHVTWNPDDSSATTATATADTNGTVLVNGSPLTLNKHELWTFAKIGGQWRITAFTYDLC